MIFSLFVVFDIWTQSIICSLFQGSGYWQWDEIAPTNFKSYPKPVGQLFKGMPSNTDAALTWTNGYVYIFKGTEYWRVNQNYQAVEKTYPLNTALRWMQCDDWATRGHWGLNINLICTMTWFNNSETSSQYGYWLCGCVQWYLLLSPVMLRKKGILKLPLT